MLHTLIKKLAPVAAMAMAFGVSGCDGMDIKINGTEGVPLAELDMAGDTPTEVVLAGPDTVIINDGDTLDIQVEGDDEAMAALRFSLEDGTLAVHREKDGWDGNGTATVTVTMPSPETLVIAGSGSLEAESLAGSANVTIAGSGSATTANVSADKLEVTVAGSGTYTAGGTAKSLELTIAGAGSAKMADLKSDATEVTIAGSGDAEFASDGNVEANIVGSGNVTVTGNATCTVNSIGSGSVKCQTVREEE
jgi:hypothetical protein